jgi:hypothetical protein
MAYDSLNNGSARKPDAEYLKILHLAAKESETAVDDTLRHMLNEDIPISFDGVETLVKSGQEIESIKDVTVEQVDISAYDTLLSERSVE